MNWKELRNLWFPNWKALRNVELPARTSAYPVFVAACVVPGDSRSVVEKSTDEIWNFVVRFLLPSVDLVPSCAVFREIRWKTGCWERGEGSKLNCCWHSTYSRSSCGESGTTRNRRKRLRSKFFFAPFLCWWWLSFGFGGRFRRAKPSEQIKPFVRRRLIYHLSPTPRGISTWRSTICWLGRNPVVIALWWRTRFLVSVSSLNSSTPPPFLHRDRAFQSCPAWSFRRRMGSSSVVGAPSLGSSSVLPGTHTCFPSVENRRAPVGPGGPLPSKHRQSFLERNGEKPKCTR